MNVLGVNLSIFMGPAFHPVLRNSFEILDLLRNLKLNCRKSVLLGLLFWKPDVRWSQGSKFKTNQYCKIRLQIFYIWWKNVWQLCKKIKKKNNFVHFPFLQSQAK